MTRTRIAAAIAAGTLAVITGATVHGIADGQPTRSDARGTTWDAPAKNGSTTRPAGIKWHAPQPVVQQAGVKFGQPKLGTTWDAPKRGTTWDVGVKWAVQTGRAWA